MPANIQALVLLLVFIVPGFLFVEVDTRRRPAQKVGAFDKTVLSVLFSTILHAILLWPILLAFLFFKFDFTKLFDTGWLIEWVGRHVLVSYVCVFAYFLLAIMIAVACGFTVTSVTRRWRPVLSRVVRRDRPNLVLVQMKNGDFFTGVLEMIPADYDVLQGSAKDFTIGPPGHYKPKGRIWQKLQEKEVVLLNTSNADAIRIIQWQGSSSVLSSSSSSASP